MKTMFKFCSLYSGSSGNCLFVETPYTKLLIDAGESAKKIENALHNISVDIHDIDAILVTHEHSDHIKGLATLSKKFHLPVYANSETWDAMPEVLEKIQKEMKNLFSPNENFDIGDLRILPFFIPHDAANPCGFNIYYGDQKISIATDIGHMNSTIIKNLEGSSFILLESNYDPAILKCSKYPYSLKQRIAGPNGHLSNEAAGKTISYLLKSGLKNVMLGHLSKENNFPELAYQTVIDELCVQNFNENEIKIGIANRSSPSSVVNLEG
jgi:phosphoribosyl 1,2-cyclic phosphodiesterase